MKGITIRMEYKGCKWHSYDKSRRESLMKLCAFPLPLEMHVPVPLIPFHVFFQKCSIGNRIQSSVCVSERAMKGFSLPLLFTTCYIKSFFQTQSCWMGFKQLYTACLVWGCVKALNAQNVALPLVLGHVCSQDREEQGHFVLSLPLVLIHLYG